MLKGVWATCVGFILRLTHDPALSVRDVGLLLKLSKMTVSTVLFQRAGRPPRRYDGTQLAGNTCGHRNVSARWWHLRCQNLESVPSALTSGNARQGDGKPLPVVVAKQRNNLKPRFFQMLFQFTPKPGRIFVAQGFDQDVMRLRDLPGIVVVPSKQGNSGAKLGCDLIEQAHHPHIPPQGTEHSVKLVILGDLFLYLAFLGQLFQQLYLRGKPVYIGVGDTRHRSLSGVKLQTLSEIIDVVQFVRIIGMHEKATAGMGNDQPLTFQQTQSFAHRRTGRSHFTRKLCFGDLLPRNQPAITDGLQDLIGNATGQIRRG